MNRVSLSAICLSAAMALPASASTVTLNYEGSGPFGTPNLQQQVDIDYTGTPGVSYDNLRAGPFSMTENGTDSFLAWCFDIFAYVANGVEYTVTEAGDTVNPEITTQRDSLLNRLFTSYFSEVDTAQEGAAFQLAIWEIVNEDLGINALSVSGGLFSASNNAGATGLAQSYLSNLGKDESFDLTYYVSGTNQDLVAGTLDPNSNIPPVPLPAGVLLLVGGLGALGFLRRKSV